MPLVFEPCVSTDISIIDDRKLSVEHNNTNQVLQIYDFLSEPNRLLAILQNLKTSEAL